jgi:tetratricopeptide (TPR) repeat protein
MKYFILALVSCLCLIGCASTIDIPKAEKTPSASSQEESSDIEHGIALNDNGNYSGAISIYEQTLAKDPDNVEALYEIALSHLRNNNFSKCLEYSLKGLEYKSQLRCILCVLAGSALDDLGKPKDAIAFYKKGIKENPDIYITYFNLAITYFKLGEMEDSEENFIKSIKLNPNYSSNYFQLAQLYTHQGKQLQPLFCLCRFLTLEPNTDRSKMALRSLEDIMDNGVTKNGATVEINISSLLDSKSPYTVLELFLKSKTALRTEENNANKPQDELRIQNLNDLFGLLAEDKDKHPDYNDFTSKYLFPYFAEAYKTIHSESLLYYIFQNGNAPATLNWLTKNKTKVDNAVKWDAGYKWNFN